MSLWSVEDVSNERLKDDSRELRSVFANRDEVRAVHSPHTHDPNIPMSDLSGDS